LNNTRFWTLASTVLATFALCVQAALPKESAIDNKLLSAVGQQSVDRGLGIDSAQQNRMRSSTIDPGSTIILRGDKIRPTVVHVIKGTLTSRPQDRPEVVLHAGYAGLEDNECLLENTAANQPNLFGCRCIERPNLTALSNSDQCCPSRFFASASGKIHIASTMNTTVTMMYVENSGRIGDPLQYAKTTATIRESAETMALTSFGIAVSFRVD
jgi:hypothetical protein